MDFAKSQKHTLEDFLGFRNFAGAFSTSPSIGLKRWSDKDLKKKLF